MKIAIEAQRLYRKKKHGMDIVALELIRNLQKLDHENEYVIFVRPDVDRSCLEESGNFKIIELKGGPYPIWEQVILPGAVKKYGCELLHCTSNTAPIRVSTPLILTLHDIIFLESSLPDLIQGGGTAYQRAGNIYRRYIVPKNVQKSARIITVSEYEKLMIANHFPQEESKVSVVYNGVSTHFCMMEDPSQEAQVRKKHKLPEKFFLMLGNTVPKKNTPGTLKAYAIYRRNAGINIPLVMTDLNHSDLMPILRKINEEDLLKHIFLTGYMDNNDLPDLYNLAELFLYPSLRESFGIPILEAQRCGTPVSTSVTSSMPEISGKASILIDPYNPSEIAQAMGQLSTNPGIHAEIVQKGLENSSKFSWHTMASAVLAMYNEFRI